MAARMVPVLAALLLLVAAGCQSPVATDGGSVDDGAPDLRVAGCRQDSDCADVAAPHCHAASRTCVACALDYQCPPGFVCGSQYECLESCTTPGDCTKGETGCCGHACIDLRSDNRNCGRCGVQCDSWLGCYDGKCSCPAWAPDLCHTRCVSYRSDATHCGGCDRPCPAIPNAWSVCVEGRCAFGNCQYLFADCDQKLDNGCEANLWSDVESCGGCGKRCAPGERCDAMRCQ